MERNIANKEVLKERSINIIPVEEYEEVDDEKQIECAKIDLFYRNHRKLGFFDEINSVNQRSLAAPCPLIINQLVLKMIFNYSRTDSARWPHVGRSMNFDY